MRIGLAVHNRGWVLEPKWKQLQAYLIGKGHTVKVITTHMGPSGPARLRFPGKVRDEEVPPELMVTNNKEVADLVKKRGIEVMGLNKAMVHFGMCEYAAGVDSVEAPPVEKTVETPLAEAVPVVEADEQEGVGYDDGDGDAHIPLGGAPAAVTRRPFQDDEEEGEAGT